MGNIAQIPSKIEESVDEIDLSSTEVGYPAPTSPIPLHDIFECKERWLTNTFNNGSDDVELLKSLNLITLDLNTMSDEYVEDEATGRPHTATAAAAADKRLAFPFAMIDNHARMADPKLLDSFEELIGYLKKPLLHDPYIKIKTARAILVWLSRQKLEGKSYGKKGTDTPRGLIQYLKEEKMSYTTCYAILCRKADLQCAVIKGYVKTEGSDDGSQPLTSWNAVHGETGWQIVQAYWTCRAMFGYKSGDWTKVEEDGKTMSKKEKASSGTEKNIFDERYFMPDPEQFIYQCCAENKEWQLVPTRSMVSSYVEFAKKPILYFSFFDLGLQLISEQNCVLESKDGFCKIELKAKPSNAHLISLRYELYRKEPDVEPSGDKAKRNERKNDGEEDYARMVFNSRAAEVFTFDIRFPRTGFYKLVIRGGPHTSGYRSLCEFRLICNQEMVGRSLLPIDCGKIGWGPGPTTKEAGLLLPSKPSGLIPVSTTDRKTDVKFQLRDMTEKYTAVVHGEVSGRRQKLDNSVHVQKIEHAHQLVVDVSLPDSGEYGLSIQHMDKKKQDSEWENVCHYLISTLTYKYEHANVKLAKKCLKDVTEKLEEPRLWKKQIKEIQKCIVKCKKEKVPDNADEMITANSMLVFLTCKDKLRDCVLRRNIHVIDKTLSIVSMYRDQDALSGELTFVKQLRNDIKALGGYARMVPRLEDAHKEIIALKHAPEEVYNTFKALLVLLGESKYKNMDWASIQARMKATHDPVVAVSILSKMTQIEKQEIGEDRVQEASEILHMYDENQVRMVNTDAHSFYVWIENIIKVHKKLP